MAPQWGPEGALYCSTPKYADILRVNPEDGSLKQIASGMGVGFEYAFAPGEMGPGMLIIHELDDPIIQSDYSQTLQLHTGWNLVSWYVWPEGNDLDPPSMDDLFKPPDPPPPEWWFDYDQEEPFSDKVGRYNSDPSPGQDQYYPRVGYFGSGDEWFWEMHQAYQIYLESPAHFWEKQSREDYNQLPFDFEPDEAWDRILAPEQQPDYWFFLGYPLRMSQLIDEDHNGVSENATIHELEDQPNQPYNDMQVLKSDDGKMYVPTHPEYSRLDYLEPGRGYFIGFGSSGNVTCPGFYGEVEPASVDPNLKTPEAGTASVETNHFLFKSRTHWWYPVCMDSIDLGQTPMEPDDEIAVFDGDLCVGATLYDGQFPVVLAAWADDISTPNQIDGYVDGNPMTFVWYDASENQEISFELPPETQAIQPEADPHRPTHSGFGVGFYAVRNLVYGIAGVNQLPQEYKLGQNFPNPFNLETVIPVELPQRSNVKIELYNVRGQNLGKIYEGIQDAGFTKVRYRASLLPSGIYLYRIEAEGLERGGHYQAADKMLLLK